MLITFLALLVTGIRDVSGVSRECVERVWIFTKVPCTVLVQLVNWALFWGSEGGVMTWTSSLLLSGYRPDLVARWVGVARFQSCRFRTGRLISPERKAAPNAQPLFLEITDR